MARNAIRRCFALMMGSCLWMHYATAELSPDFYSHICPQALPVIRLAVKAAIAAEPRMGASLLRLHFHDCFVNGCDASVLLDDTAAFTGEKMAAPNNNSLRGFEVVDVIKAAVDLACLRNVVSCADILAVAARDSIVALGGKSYDVELGRRDGTTASLESANKQIPSPVSDLPALLSSFDAHGLGLSDLVVLSGAHSLGFARCVVFRSRIYGDNSPGGIDAPFAQGMQAQCPREIGAGDDIPASLDNSPTRFDTDYYSGLRLGRGLLHTDQQLFGGGGDTDTLVRYYSDNQEAFWTDFGAAMLKMGSLGALTGDAGEIRSNCRYVNHDNNN